MPPSTVSGVASIQRLEVAQLSSLNMFSLPFPFLPFPPPLSPFSSFFPSFPPAAKAIQTGLCVLMPVTTFSRGLYHDNQYNGSLYEKDNTGD